MGKSYWYILVKCNHTESWILKDNLFKGKSRGCKDCRGDKLRKYQIAESDTRKLIMSRWGAMRSRCLNPSNRAYKWYGARGITLSPHFENFEYFFNYVKSLPNFNSDLQIDRIDNNNGYIEGNLRFVDSRTNQFNKRGIKIVIFQGKEIYFYEFYEKLKNLSVPQAYTRLQKGKSTEEIIKEDENYEGLRRFKRGKRSKICNKWENYGPQLP